MDYHSPRHWLLISRLPPSAYRTEQVAFLRGMTRAGSRVYSQPAHPAQAPLAIQQFYAVGWGTVNDSIRDAATLIPVQIPIEFASGM